MGDTTEDLRRVLVAEINSNAGERAELEKKHGEVWDLDQLREQFEVVQFAAPFVVVRRKEDGVRGAVLFQHSPHFYWGFEPEKGA